MKKTITTTVLAIVSLLGSSAFIIKYQNGIAGYTASPQEASCNSCHSGGSSASSTINISATPTFSNDEFVPGQTYTITVDVSASGFSNFGFGCEILDDQAANAGTMQNPGSGVKFLFAGSRKNAVHTTPKVSPGMAQFAFEWVAPTVGDTAIIYAAGNAVNGNGLTSGDFPVTPVTMSLKAQETLTVVGIKEQGSQALSYLSVYPNPASNLTTISYALLQPQEVNVQLIGLQGQLVKEFIHEKQNAGSHAQLLDLHGVAPGIYFMKLSGNGTKLSQKLITVQ